MNGEMMMLKGKRREDDQLTLGSGDWGLGKLSSQVRSTGGNRDQGLEDQKDLSKAEGGFRGLEGTGGLEDLSGLSK